MQCEWFDGLVQEAAKIHAAMEERYPGFVELCKAKRRKEKKPEDAWAATAIQIFYDDVESSLQLRVIGGLPREVQSRVLINCDALFIPKTVGVDKDRLQVPEMGIRYVLKPMIQPSAIPDIDVALQRVNGEVEPVGAYAEWKQVFERTNFYLTSMGKYVTINERTKDLYYTSQHDFVNSRYLPWKENVQQWVEDVNRLSYDRIVNMPPPNVCHPRDFNLWGFSAGFRAASLPELHEDDDMDALVGPVLDMFRHIVSFNERHYEYLLNYMADSLQNPGVKRAQYIGMYGEQGVGKNELMERFWLDKIIGPTMSVTYKSIAEWAEKHETGWHDKMWVMVHEAEYKDFTTHYQFLKGVTGSLIQNLNEKNVKLQKVEFYGRIIMLSNYVNAFNEDNLISRRQGLRCIASPFRDIPNALEILADEKVQRAFYDYLMERDVDEWDAERDRVDSDSLRDANFMTTFRKEQGNMMMILLYVAIDKIYETYRKIDDRASVQPTYLEDVAFPQSLLFDAYFELCNFEADEKRRKNAHIVNFAALGAHLDPSGRLGIMSQAGRQRYPFFKSSQMIKPGFKINYPGLKNALEERMSTYNIADHVDLDLEKHRVLTKLEAYHQEQLDAGWEYRPSIAHVLPKAQPKKAHRVEGGYVIRQGGEIVFESKDIEEINRELGEAWLETLPDKQLLHMGKKVTDLGDAYMRPYGKTMLEMVFPCYVRDRTQ
jgi:hypothetical protein